MNDAHYLGKLCPRGHSHKNSGKSLRSRTAKNACVRCIREYNLEAQARRRLSKPKGVSTCLGKLCLYGHSHEGTGQSLRYYVSGACVVCSRLSRNQNKAKKRSDNALVRIKQAATALLDQEEPADRVPVTRTKSFFFGDMCKKKHDSDGHGRSLRYEKRPERCVVCQRENCKNNHHRRMQFPKTQPCPTIPVQIAYYEKKLEQPLRKFVYEHIRSCPECKAMKKDIVEIFLGKKIF